MLTGVNGDNIIYWQSLYFLGLCEARRIGMSIDGLYKFFIIFNLVDKKFINTYYTLLEILEVKKFGDPEQKKTLSQKNLKQKKWR